MTIRRALKKDIEQISQIFLDNIAQKPYSYTITPKESKEIISAYFKNYIIFVAEEKGILTGFIIGSKYFWIGGWRLWISELFVDINKQNKGIGTKLLDAIQHHFKNKGVKVVELLSHKNAAAMDFYKKGGFNETDFIKLEKVIN